MTCKLAYVNPVAIYPASCSVHYLSPVIIVIDRVSLRPGINGINVTALYLGVPCYEGSCHALFRRPLQILFRVLPRTDLIDVGVVLVPPVYQRNIPVAENSLSEDIKTMICCSLERNLRP